MSESKRESTSAPHAGSQADSQVPNLNRPTSYQLTQLALGILELGIVKPLDPVGSDDPRDNELYDCSDDPLNWHPNYDQVAAEALKLWNANVKALEDAIPAIFRPLLDHIFEPIEEWELWYRKVCDAGWDPDELLFRRRWPEREVADGLYADTKYQPSKLLERFRDLVNQSREAVRDRWGASEWEQKLLRDPLRRNQIVPPACWTESPAPDSPPVAPWGMSNIFTFNGIEIRALFEIKKVILSRVKREAGKQGGRPKEA